MNKVKSNNFGTSTANIGFGNTVTVQTDQLNQMVARIERLEQENKRLEEIMLEYERTEQKSNLDLSAEDIKYILMKCHPDKNPNSKKSIELTKKILKMRNKNETNR